MTKRTEIKIKLGPNKTVTAVWRSRSPIYLLRLETKGGKVIRSRFDVQKAIFIDLVGLKVTPREMTKLATALLGSRSARSSHLKVHTVKHQGRTSRVRIFGTAKRTALH